MKCKRSWDVPCIVNFKKVEKGEEIVLYAEPEPKRQKATD